MNKILFTLLHVICMVYSNPVKKDGVSYKLSSGELKSYDDIPIMVVKLIPSSESSSEDIEHEVPIEFPFQIAKSIDEILNLNRNSFQTEKPKVDNSATCLNTDIVLNTEATTQDPTEVKELNLLSIERKTRDDRKFRNVNKEDRSESESSVYMSHSKPSISEDSKMLKELLKVKKQRLDKLIETDKKIEQNQISRSSKEESNLFEETIVLKKVDGKPVKGTLTIEKINNDEADLIGKEDVTDHEDTNLDGTKKVEEKKVPYSSYILDVLMSQFLPF